MPFARGLGLRVMLGASVAFVSLAPACSKSTTTSVLQDADLTIPASIEAPFDRNNIVDENAFVDIDSLDVTIVQKFLHRTPYDRATFLETYQSNGVRASDAITRAARTYHINPLVFLVEAEAAEGLIGAANYPFPPERVEYVFRCGCLQGDNCIPELAGFDRQVDCLGRALRVALDQMGASDFTAAGWGKDKTSTTLDNLKVTPTTKATAAIYDHTPRVAEHAAGGAWLFWNVWNVYAAGIDYAGPIGGPGAGGWIGDKCASSAGCAIEGATCATDYPGGLCTLACKGDCPSQQDKTESFCADFSPNGGFCLQVCNPGASACRDGYACLRLRRLGATDAADSKYVCTLPP